MKALIRGDGETVTEDMGIDGIDWTTGAPLTNPDWCGGPYELVIDYTEPTVATSGMITSDTVPTSAPEGVVIKTESVTLTEEDVARLRRLLG